MNFQSIIEQNKSGSLFGSVSRCCDLAQDANLKSSLAEIGSKNHRSRSNSFQSTETLASLSERRLVVEAAAQRAQTLHREVFVTHFFALATIYLPEFWRNYDPDFVGMVGVSRDDSDSSKSQLSDPPIETGVDEPRYDLEELIVQKYVFTFLKFITILHPARDTVFSFRSCFIGKDRHNLFRNIF